jgi:hypothetical protein
MAPNHGVVNIDDTGGVASFVCRHGYYLIGSKHLLCEGGRWTGVYPICVGEGMLLHVIRHFSFFRL